MLVVPLGVIGALEFRRAASFPKYFVDLGSKHLDKDRDLAAQRAPHAP